GVDLEEMVQGITRTTVRISHPASALSQVRAAVRAARNPANPGPVLVVGSIDQLDDQALHGPNSVQPPLSNPRAVDDGLMKRIADVLEHAARPLMVLGAGCRPVADAMRELVDAVGIPFMTTPQAKGIVSEEHPLSLRNGGMSASQWARKYTQAGPDVTLVLASDLDDSSTAGTRPIRHGGTLIHVDTDKRVLGRNFTTAIPVAHDAGVFAWQLAAEMRARNSTALARRGAALAAEARRDSPFEVAYFESDSAVPIAPHRVVADLERAAGPRTTFVTDIGEHMLFALHYLTVCGPDRFVIHLGLGSMASGIASSVGLALADRSRTVVCICGDGGMQMAGMEILLAIKHRLPIVYAIFNDARYNMVYHGHRLTFGHASDWETPQIDFVKWAESAGARGQRIERPGEITQELLAGPLKDGVPLVLDVRQDRDVRIQGEGRISAMIQMQRGTRSKEKR
ncbi:MAG TPA: thiamine pyrophosphate-dependent enzyme, partial [Polyangiaceae bacterium]|nr:thiamine pyrophosphate-dependent enzyme [Polyangiaceae bacterium]